MFACFKDLFFELITGQFFYLAPDTHIGQTICAFFVRKDIVIVEIYAIALGAFKRQQTIFILVLPIF